MTLALPTIDRRRLTEILQRLPEVRLLVVGDLMLDRYLEGEVERISPEAPVPVVNMNDEWCVPGGAANVGANAIALGATCRLIGVIGDDDAGTTLSDAVSAHGISTNGFVVVHGRPTTTKTRIIARGQQVVRIDREVTTSLPPAARDALIASALDALEGSDGLVLEDYDKGVFDAEVIRQLIAAATARKLPVVVDPKIRNFFHYAGATVFKPNQRELDQAFGTQHLEEGTDLTEARRRLTVEHLLVTMGAGGMMLASADSAPRRAPSLARDVFDVSGAGDTVSAWLSAALCAGASVPEGAWIANVAASVEVGKRGTATVSQSEFLEAWERGVG